MNSLMGNDALFAACPPLKRYAHLPPVEEPPPDENPPERQPPENEPPEPPIQEPPVDPELGALERRCIALIDA